MAAIRKKRINNNSQVRRALLAKIHIARKDLGMSAEDYRDILVREYRVASSAVMSIPELADLVNRFIEKGWKDGRPGGRETKTDGQARALRARVVAVAAGIENGEKRLAGLIKKICGVDRLGWCRDPEKLKRLLAILSKLGG